jgi:hypothetical protein
MKPSLNTFFRQRIPLACFLICYLLFAAFKYKDYGIKWDEYINYMGGYWLYQDITGHPQSAIRDDSDIPASSHFDHFYAMILYAVNQKLTIPGFHLSNLLFTGSILVVGYESVLSCCLNPWLALLGPLFLVLNPRFFGEWANNPKDTPFAVFYFISLFLIYHWRRSEKITSLLILGFFIGATTCVRLFGLSLLVVYVLFEVHERFLTSTGMGDFKKWLFSLLWCLTVLTGSIFLVLWMTWPFLRESPLTHGLRLIHMTSAFPWNSPVLFEGQGVPATELDRSYLPLWFLISTPLYILILSLTGAWFLPKKNPSSFGSFLVLVLVFHSLVYLALKPNVYDGIRHYLFLEPVFSIIACLTFIEVIYNGPKIKWLLVLLAAANMLVVAWHIFELYPDEYIYFNEVVGGLRGAAGRFETDYSGSSYKEAVDWLETEEIKDPHRLYRVNTEGCAFQSAHYFLPNMQWAYLKDADYFIANTRLNSEYKADPKKIIHIVEREGVPLTYVFKLH